MYRLLTLLFVICSLVAGCTPQKNDLSASIQKYGAAYSLCDEGNQTACDAKAQLEPALLEDIYDRMEIIVESGDKNSLENLLALRQQLFEAANVKYPPNEYRRKVLNVMFLALQGVVSDDVVSLAREARENRYVDERLQSYVTTLHLFEALALYVNHKYTQSFEIYKKILLDPTMAPDMSFFATIPPAAAYKAGHPEFVKEMVKAYSVLTMTWKEILKSPKADQRAVLLLKRQTNKNPELKYLMEKISRYAFAPSLLMLHIDKMKVTADNYKLARALAESLILARNYTEIPKDALARAHEIVRQADAIESRY